MHCKTAKEVAAVCVLVAGDKPRFTTVISGRTWLGAPVDITWAPNVARDAALTGGGCHRWNPLPNPWWRVTVVESSRHANVLERDSLPFS